MPSGPEPTVQASTSWVISGANVAVFSVAFTLDDDPRVGAHLVHGVAPGSRGGGGLVETADEVLGWAVLPGRGVA